MTAATAFWAGTITGLIAAVLLTNATHRAFAWIANRISSHVNNALPDDDDEDDPLEQAWRLDARKPAA